jgi:folate-binding protein YgfZ
MHPSKTLIFRPSGPGRPASAPGPLPPRPYHWTWVSLEGPDAQDFLQRLTTVAAGGLMLGSGSLGCWLSAQGKFRAMFTLWRYSDEGFAFEFDAGANHHWNTQLLQAIDQYTFSEKMTLTEASARGAIACAWVFPFPGDSRIPAELAPGETLATDSELRFCHHGSRDFGRAWITIWGRPARLEQWLDQNFAQDASATTLEELEAARIEATRPRVDSEISPELNPLEAGLPDSVAENKGCYPGQEIIEKIAAIGSPAKRLVQVRFDADSSGDAPFERTLQDWESATPVGELTSLSGRTALAVVRKTHAREGAKVRRGADTGTVTRVAPYTREGMPPT